MFWHPIHGFPVRAMHGSDLRRPDLRYPVLPCCKEPPDRLHCIQLHWRVLYVHLFPHHFLHKYRLRHLTAEYMPVSYSGCHIPESRDDTEQHNQNRSFLCVSAHHWALSDFSVHPVLQSLLRYSYNVLLMQAELPHLLRRELP